MKRVMIIPSKCHNCSSCEVEEFCPKKAIFREDMIYKPWVDFFKCSGCLKCKTVCPYQAIEELTRPCSEKLISGW